MTITDKQVEAACVAWFSSKPGEEFHDATKSQMRKALDAAFLASHAVADEVIGVAQALEQQRALKIVADVEALAGKFEATHAAGFAQACEEVTHRLRTEVWDGCLPPIGAAAPERPNFPQGSNIIALATEAVGYWANGEMVDGYASAMIDLEAALSAAPSSAEQPAKPDFVRDWSKVIRELPMGREASGAPEADEQLTADGRVLTGGAVDGQVGGDSELAQLERDTLECTNILGEALVGPALLHIGHLPSMCRDLVEELRAARAQSSAAPVAIRVRFAWSHEWHYFEANKDTDKAMLSVEAHAKAGNVAELLYTTPPADARDGDHVKRYLYIVKKFEGMKTSSAETFYHLLEIEGGDWSLDAAIDRAMGATPAGAEGGEG